MSIGFCWFCENVGGIVIGPDVQRLDNTFLSEFFCKIELHIDMEINLS